MEHQATGPPLAPPASEDRVVFHNNTEQLMAYWRSLRRGGALPVRRDFDPTQVFELLPQLFMLDIGAARLPFRLAGEFLIDLHGKPLKGVDFQGLFVTASRRIVAQATLAALGDPEPVVLDAEAFTEDGRSMTLEIMLAPLTDAEGRPERLLGLYQPTSLVARLHGKPVVGMSATMAVHATNRGAHLKLAAVDGLRIA